MRWVVVVFALSGCQALFRLDYVDPPRDGRTDSSTRGDGNGSGSGSGTVGPRIVFVTASMFAGDLSSGTGGSDALAGADSLCQGEANVASLPGAYRAWLSTLGTPAAGRMTHTGGPFVLPIGTPVAVDWGAFAFSVSGGQPHTAPIDVTPAGTHITAGICDVWTNTLSDGTPAQSDITKDCYDWTVVDQGVGSPLGSTSQTDSRFTANFSCAPLACSAMARLYCVQQ